MLPPVPIRRAGYQIAYVLLRIWWLVRSPEVRGVKCLITDGDRVLLVRHTYGRRQWDLPGGAIKRREQPIEAATREIQEELGLTVRDWRSLGRMQSRTDHRHDTLHCFQADLRAPRIVSNQVEIRTARWFERHALPPRLARFVQPILAAAESQPPD